MIFTFPPFPRLHTLSEHSVFGQKAVDVQIAQHAFRRNGKKRTKSHRFAAKNNKIPIFFLIVRKKIAQKVDL